MNPPSSQSQQQPLNSGIHKIGPTHPEGSNFWYESIDHNGQSPFIPNGATWKVFRNVVTDYGADNTGRSDASKAITKAITGLSLTRTFRALTHKSKGLSPRRPRLPPLWPEKRRGGVRPLGGPL